MRFSLRAIRLTLATLILFLITWYFQVPERIWGLITIWFVMFEYNTVGGVLLKGFYRFIGTLISAIYGLCIIYFFYNDVVINMLAIVPGIFLYVYYFMDTEKAYIAIIGCVTLTIVLLNHNDIDAAILRTFNVILGILLSMFMMRFFYPQYAKDEIMNMQLEFLQQMSTRIQHYLDLTKPLSILKEEARTLDEQRISLFATYNRRIKEASVETKNTPSFSKHLKQSFAHTRHIFRLLDSFVDLAREDWRSNDHIQHQLKALLAHLSVLEKRLRSMPITPTSTSLGSPPIVPHDILESIHQEIALLDGEIQPLIQIYDQIREA